MKTKNSILENKVKNFDWKKASIAVIEEANRQRLKEAIISREEFLRMPEVILPEDLRKDPTKIFALNYDCNSKVGQVTNIAMAICTANPSDLLDEKNFKKAFKTNNGHGTVKSYKSIFKDKINIISYYLKVDSEYKLKAYYVSNKEINEFAKRVGKLKISSLTVEDIKTIQADLWFLFRAWQESSIDVTKDKSKQYVLDLLDVLGKIEVRTTMKFEDMSTNMWEIKKAKRENEENPGFVIDFGIYDEDEGFVETKLSVLQDKLRDHLEPIMNVISETYFDATCSMYKEYILYAKRYPMMALVVSEIGRLVRDYNNVSSEEKEAGYKLTTREYAILRAVIYSQAADLNIDPELVVKIGLGALGSEGIYVTRAGNIVVKDFDEKEMSKNMYVAEKLFGNILIAEEAELFNATENVENGMILTPIEPFHIFEDVEEGIYDIEDGNVFNEDGDIIFDTLTDYTGEVEVIGDKVYFYYDPLCEVDLMPNMTFVMSYDMLDKDGKKDVNDDRGERLQAILDTIDGDFDIEIEEGEDGVSYCSICGSNDLFVSRINSPGTWHVSSYLGVPGIRVVPASDEDGTPEYYKRSNKYLFIDYDEKEMAEYINSVTMFME